VSSNGDLDESWRGPELGPPGSLVFFSLAPVGDRIVVAGAFRSADGRRVPGLVALAQKSGLVDRTWRPTSLCYDGNHEIVSNGGRVYVATACAAPPCLVQLRPSDGAVVAEWAADIAAIGEIGCVNGVDASNGMVAFTGGSTAVAGSSRHGIAAVDARTARPVAGFAPHGGCAGVGQDIVATTRVVFTGGDQCPIAAFALATGKTLWSIPRTKNGTTAALIAYGGRIYVGGTFQRLAGKTVNGLAALDQRSGRSLSMWHPPADSHVLALSLSADRIVVGAL
jgi:outer membrane protein assembly factor BamB